MVDLEPLQEPEDIELVRDLIEHAGYTGSEVAARILGDWPAIAAKFVKVMPIDYKRAIAEQLDAAKQEVQAAQSQGNGKGNGRKAKVSTKSAVSRRS